MINPVKTRSKGIRKGVIRLVLVLYLLLIAALFYGVSFVTFSSFRYANAYNRTLETPSDSLAYSLPAVSEARARRAFLEARSMLVDADSVSLAVNLADSTVTLEQNGVVLHTASISGLRVSRVFSRIHEIDLAEALSFPLIVEDSWSTIPRKRYVRKMAPSDTTEVPVVSPDTSSAESVFFRLALEKGIQLDIMQSEFPLDNQKKRFEKRVNHWESGRILTDLLAFRVPEYHPVITIELPEKDVRAIYRALPVHARVALRI